MYMPHLLIYSVITAQKMFQIMLLEGPNFMKTIKKEPMHGTMP